ncbi:MAG TPA: amidohydrolase [Anaerovoracaceae bacterium]|nr:amidohydrolase [Anaerovoracaceae bacterium]
MRKKERDALTEGLIQQYEPEFIQWRRYFHRNPELSFEEFETSDFIAERLSEMGYAVKRNIGGTGVIGMLDTGKPGPVIAFRADMDALPLIEATGLPFESAKCGLMHGCGHDAHMAVVLGTAKILSLAKEELKGCIKMIFQPGEEANGGAKCMINDGALKDPDVEAIFALHIIPELEAGTIGIKDGYLSATDDEVAIRVYGISCHSSAPEDGVNAIMIAANILTALQSIQTNCISPHDVATFSICKIKGGDAINVLADYVEMSGMIRCIEKKNKLIFREKIEKISHSIAAAMGGTAEIDVIEGFPAVNNDPKLTGLVMDAASESLGSPERVILIKHPHLGSEDFSYYQEEIPGVMFMLGAGTACEDRGTLHSTALNIHEDSLAYGVRIFANVAMRMCGAEAP